MKVKILPVITAAAAAAAVLTVLFIPKNGGKPAADPAGSGVKTVAEATQKTQKDPSRTAEETEARVNADGDIEISADELKADRAAVLSYSLDGTKIGFLAVKDGEGNIHTAFNTCQVCYGSPKAYFVQKNGKLICQNCGNQFALSSIGGTAMGCNPITIDDYVEKTENGVVISKDFLNANKELFRNWKKL